MTTTIDELTHPQRVVLNYLFQKGMRSAAELAENSGRETEDVEAILLQLVELEFVEEKDLNIHYVEDVKDHTGMSHKVKGSREEKRYLTTLKAQKARK